MDKRLIWLAVGSFTISTEGFVISSLLPDIASDAGISVPLAGCLITAFALAYALGTPVLATLTGDWDRRRVILSTLAAFVVGNVVAALSSSFEVLLGARQATLADLPEGTFMLEVTRLVPKPAFAFVAVERADWIYSEPTPPDRDAVERAMLGDDYDRADAIRHRVNATIAYAAGEGLPEDVRRYLAGAAAYSHDDDAEAERRFESVLAGVRNFFKPTLIFDRRSHIIRTTRKDGCIFCSTATKRGSKWRWKS